MPSHSTPKRFTKSQFIAAWNNPKLSRADVADQFGMALSTAHRMGKILGLPHRKRGFAVKFDTALFAAMWIAGVKSSDIQTALGICPATVTLAVTRQGLPLRGRGRSVHRITVDQFRAQLLSRVMARDARAEQSAIINAEMADSLGRENYVVGRNMARAA